MLQLSITFENVKTQTSNVYRIKKDGRRNKSRKLCQTWSQITESQNNFFSRDLLEWEPFREIFETAIVKSERLANFEKFTYLPGYLERTALHAIDGFPLTSENHGNAWISLK